MANQEALKLGKQLIKRKKSNLWMLIIGFVLIVFGSGAFAESRNSLAPVPSGSYRVTEVLDGDTIAVNMNGTTEKVRLIGVDTPETQDPRKAIQCFGQAASDFSKKLMEGQPVRLEDDSTNQNRDRYNRLLRYVYLSDGRLANAEIIKEGYGFAYTSFPFQKMEEFKTYQTQARQQNKGLWSQCTPTENESKGFISNDEI